MLRLAEIEDIPLLVGFSQKFHDFSIYKDYDFSEEKVAKTLAHMIQNPTDLVLMKDFSGVLLATIQEMIFGSDKLACELMFWVEPEHRGQGSWELVKAYEYWAKKLGCKLSVLSSLEPNKLDKAYRRMEYRPYEYGYVKVL